MTVQTDEISGLNVCKMLAVPGIPHGADAFRMSLIRPAFCTHLGRTFLGCITTRLPTCRPPRPVEHFDRDHRAGED